MDKISRRRIKKPAHRLRLTLYGFFSALITLTVVLLTLILLAKPSLFSNISASTPTIKSNLTNITLETPSPKPTPTAIPTAKPTPKPLLIPQSYGRSVHLPILYYHYIGNNPNPADKARDSLSITPDRFTEEMKYLSENGYHTVTYPELYAALKGQGGLPSKPVMLSFDDGYIDFYINAFPILRQYNLKSVAFIPTGKAGSGFYLHWDQIKEMDSTGLVDFEAHSVDHVNLQSLSQDKLVFQLVESKKRLELELGHPVKFMAYPYGSSDERVWEAVKKAGYLSAVGTWSSNIHSEGQIYDLPRIRMGGAVSLEQFKQKVQ